MSASQAGLAPKIARHAADEDKHGRIFAALLRKRLEPVPVPADTDYTMRLEHAGIGLAHKRLRREEMLTEADIVTCLAHSRSPSGARRVEGHGRLRWEDRRACRLARAAMQRATATWFQFGETLLIMSPLVTTVRISAPSIAPVSRFG